MSNKALLAISGIATSLLTGVAFAHHSAAMFDDTKTITLTGTVKQFLWTQPHGWIVMMVPDPKGGPAVEWRTETGTPTLMMRMGLKKSDLPVGMKITLRVHPLRDGRPAAQLIDVLRPDGSIMAHHMQPPPMPKAPH